VIPMPPHRTKGPGALGAPGPGANGSFGRWPEPDKNDPAQGPPPETLRTHTLVCPHCAAGPADGQTRTLALDGDRLSVTWHAVSCPHHAADRVLAEHEPASPNPPGTPPHAT
jgi:hypothetical protein